MNSSMIVTEPLRLRPGRHRLGGARDVRDGAHAYAYLSGPRTAGSPSAGAASPTVTAPASTRPGGTPPSTVAHLSATLRRLFPAVGRRRRGPGLERRARGGPGLVPVGRRGAAPGRRRPQAGRRSGLGRRLRRRRCDHLAPGRPHPGRPDPGARHVTVRPPVGRPHQPGVGARAAALARGAGCTPCTGPPTVRKGATPSAGSHRSGPAWPIGSLAGGRDGRPTIGNRQPAPGNRQPAPGNRQPAAFW